MIEKNNDFENIIKKICTEEIEVPNHAKNTIKRTIENYQGNKRKKAHHIIKLLASGCAACILVTGVVFAKDISKTIKNIFLHSEGMDNAIEHGYIDYPNIEYIDSNGTEITINKVLMDDYNLCIEFSINISESIKVENLEEFEFTDMIITDENKKILYCEDEETFKSYCQDNNLKYEWKKDNENYINTGGNKYVSSVNGNTLYLTYNLCASNFPKSKKLFINLTQILYNNNIIKGNWQIEYDVPEKFYKREEIIYYVKKCSSDKIQIEHVIVSETSTKLQLIAEEKNEILYSYLTDDEETRERKIDEEIERQKNMTYEEFMESRKFKNEYIENERGEKFYPAKSTSEDAGYTGLDENHIIHWQTFTLNKYNTTNSLKIYMNYKGENVEIELERKIN